VAVRRYHKAILLTIACTLVVVGGLARAVVQAPRPLTSAEVLAATRHAVDAAVDAAIEEGGLPHAESFVAARVADELRRQGFGGVDARIRRPSDRNPLAVFYFFVDVRNETVRFDLEGVRDPLLAVRLGVDVRIRADPFHPYEGHREPGILAACVSRHLYHAAPDAPDFFARLENRTSDPYHFGFESFLTDGTRLAVDHVFLETGAWGLDEEHRQRYGL
jgi:hypothetical protein